MNLDAATFKTFLPEFRSTGDAQIALVLTEAAKGVDAELFGETYEQAVFYRAAHMLALSPQGQSAKLVATLGGTTYQKHYERLCRECGAGGFRVCD